MTLSNFDHVNVRTANLDGLLHFYCEVLGLEKGPRPAFRFDGAWLRCGDRASLHLREVPSQPNTGEPRIEHFAFWATDLAEFVARLRRHQVAYTISVVPELGNKQVNIHDPDGNHVEIQFAAEEEADLSPFDGAPDQPASKA